MKVIFVKNYHTVPIRQRVGDILIDYAQKLQELATHIVAADQRQFLNNELQTSFAVVIPFLEIFGYKKNLPNPTIEHDNGTSQTSTLGVVHSLNWNQQTNVVIKVNAVGSPLGLVERNQLRDYYGSILLRDGRAPKLAILTNGTEFQFYTDSKIEKSMDNVPFYVFNLLLPTEDDFSLLRHFHIQSFDQEQMHLEVAGKAKLKELRIRKQVRI